MLLFFFYFWIHIFFIFLLFFILFLYILFFDRFSTPPYFLHFLFYFLTVPLSNKKWQGQCQTENDSATVQKYLYIYIYMQFVFACFCCFFLLLPLCLVCTIFSSIFWANQQKRRGAAQWGEGAQPTKPILSQWTCGSFNDKNMLSMISYTWL